MLAFSFLWPTGDAGIPVLYYGIFVVGVLLFLALDLGLFNRKAHKISFKEALSWSVLWFSLALVFAFCATGSLKLMRIQIPVPTGICFFGHGG